MTTQTKPTPEGIASDVFDSARTAYLEDPFDMRGAIVRRISHALKSYGNRIRSETIEEVLELVVNAVEDARDNQNFKGAVELEYVEDAIRKLGEIK